MLSTSRFARHARSHRSTGRLQQCTQIYRRRYATVTDLNRLPQTGAQLHGFTLQRTKHVPELKLSALHFTHDKTGADYLHIARDDKNNVFSIGFKTNPPDATGVPHILEHVTLCGSEKYPVRDPFFKMLPRSLQNFMNAFTSSHYTMYPFATTNAQDFQNLMGVYLDATLHPLLKKSDFVQEGWRIGPENPQEQKESPSISDLVFKGVVYNEMKGQMSDAMYLYYIRFMEHIFPAINNSGGDPQKMTDLTYEQLKHFHQSHYHPSNSKILTYGDQSVERHLEMLAPQLERFEKVEIDRDLKQPTQINGPRFITVKGPVDPLTALHSQYKTSTSWIMGDTSNIHETFALQLALSILMSGYGSPFYRALIESGLGTDYTPNSGFDTSSRRAVFSIGVNGVKEENVEKVKDAIVKTIREAIDKGVDDHKVQGTLHQLELALKHKTASFGVGLMQRLEPGWFNGLDPFEALSWNTIVDNFKGHHSRGGYLEGLLSKYLTSDDTLTFTMIPSEQYAADLAAEEAARLDGKIKAVVEQHKGETSAYNHLRDRELELLEAQGADQTKDLESLPTLRVSDIERKQTTFETRDSTVKSNTTVQWRETATNGLTYFRALSLLQNIPTELRMLVPLFCDALMRIGTKTKTMEQIEDEIKLRTGGIGFGYHASVSPHDIANAHEGLKFSGYALDRNISAMYELIRTILVETDFDSPKAHTMIKQLLQAGASGAVDGIAESGHVYAMTYSKAGLSQASSWAEQTGGLSQIKLITDLAAAEDNAQQMSELVSKLKAIQAIVVANFGSNFRVALTCGVESVSSNEAALQKFLETAKGPSESAYQASNSHAPISGIHQGEKAFFPFPYQVSYAALSLPTGPYTDPKTASLGILAKLLTHKHLHHEIREKGGAYGGGATTSGLGGTFGMYSYRDPNPSNTLSVMRNAGRYAASHDWTDRELEEAKLSVFQGWDAPISVNSEGMTRFLSGISDEMQQTRREWYLDVTKADVTEAAERLVQDLEGGKASLTVLGVKKSFVDDEGWSIKDMGMASTASPAAADDSGNENVV